MDALIYSYIPLTILFLVNILIVHNLVKARDNITRLQKCRSKPKDLTYNSNLTNMANKNKLSSFACFRVKRNAATTETIETLVCF